MCIDYLVSLLRVLGVGFGLAVTVGNTVGAGILRAPGEVAALVSWPWLVMALWLAGGLYALLGAVSLSELGAMMPRSGGYYVFARRALGDFPAFVVGWTDWLAQSGSMAVAAILVGEYAGELLPALRGRQVAIAVATVFGLALLQARGIRWGALVQNLASGLKGLLFLLLVLAFLLLAPPAVDGPSISVRFSGRAAGGGAAAGAAGGHLHLRWLVRDHLLRRGGAAAGP